MLKMSVFVWTLVMMTSGQSWARNLIAVAETPSFSTGSINIESNPPGSMVTVDGIPRTASTPMFLDHLKEGTHSILLQQYPYKDVVTQVRVSKDQTSYVNATMPMDCPDEIVGDLGLPSEVEIDWLNENATFFRGWANNVDPLLHRIVLWVLTDIWYIQPLVIDPWTDICKDGYWESWSHSGTRAVALVVDSTYVPSATLPKWDHPANHDGVLAFDDETSPGFGPWVDWSGFRWYERVGGPGEPGPNWFSSADSSVWVGPDGLHLRIAEEDSVWKSVGLQLSGYVFNGIFELRMASPLSAIDPNVRLEMDIEQYWYYYYYWNRLGLSFTSDRPLEPEGAHYYVGRDFWPGYRKGFETPTDALTTHRIEWMPDHITFTSWRGHGPYPPDPKDLLEEWTFMEYIPAMNWHRLNIKFWLNGGESPVMDEPSEVILQSFTYIPN